MNPKMDFDAWFEKATTGNVPSPYQKGYATEVSLPQLVDVPTGMGKMIRLSMCIAFYRNR